jgi:hypothetical protein
MQVLDEVIDKNYENHLNEDPEMNDAKSSAIVMAEKLFT